MVTCKNCGCETPEGKFCISCGNPLQNIEDQIENNQNEENEEKIIYANPNDTTTFNDNINNNTQDSTIQENTFSNNTSQENKYQDTFRRPDYSQNNNYANNLNNNPQPDYQSTNNNVNYNPPQNTQQYNMPAQQNTQIQNPYNNQEFNYQVQEEYNNQPANEKSKLIGFLLNFFVPGLGYGYVDRWKEGIIIFIAYSVMWGLGILLLIVLIGFIFLIAALAIWLYSLVKTMEMIDKYNAGLPY